MTSVRASVHTRALSATHVEAERFSKQFMLLYILPWAMGQFSYPNPNSLWWNDEVLDQRRRGWAKLLLTFRASFPVLCIFCGRSNFVMTSLDSELNGIFEFLASRDIFLCSCTQIRGAVTHFLEPHRMEKNQWACLPFRADIALFRGVCLFHGKETAKGRTETCEIQLNPVFATESSCLGHQKAKKPNTITELQISHLTFTSLTPKYRYIFHTTEAAVEISKSLSTFLPIEGWGK